MGEIVLQVGAPNGWGPVGMTKEQLANCLDKMQKAATENATQLTVIRELTCEIADVLVRRSSTSSTAPPIEIRVAIIGNVDSGKSTMVGVLTRSLLDDGRGLARSKVFKHSHEESTGRTSSIGQHNLCLDSTGKVLNDGAFRTQTCGDYISRASKIITLVDLAGHEKYFRTTAYGLTGHLPDYACLIVGANMGVVGMTADEVLLCARNMNTDSLAPVFLTSAVTGEGMDLVRMFYNLMPQRQRWFEKLGELPEFVIDETFGVPGVGTVVAGTVKKGVITQNCNLLIGPDIGDGSFKAVSIKSIHYKRLPVSQVAAGQTAALALKKVKRSQGMVMVDERAKPKSSWEFDADIAILTHSTTIQPRYQAGVWRCHKKKCWETATSGESEIGIIATPVPPCATGEAFTGRRAASHQHEKPTTGLCIPPTSREAGARNVVVLSGKKQDIGGVALTISTRLSLENLVTSRGQPLRGPPPVLGYAGFVRGLRPSLLASVKLASALNPPAFCNLLKRAPVSILNSLIPETTASFVSCKREIMSSTALMIPSSSYNSEPHGVDGVYGSLPGLSMDCQVNQFGRDSNSSGRSWKADASKANVGA
eukprot:gene29190-31090_t